MLRENLGAQIEKFTADGKDTMHNLFDENENDAEAIDAERSGRTNAARDAAAGHGPGPGRWDSIGEGGEGLDELQGLYAADAPTQDHLAERGPEAVALPTEASARSSTAITPILWDRLMALEGATIETPKGEPFGVKAVSRGEHVTVSPLDGGQEWEVSARDLEAAWTAVSGGARLDGLASIRLQEAGLGSTHPEYIAGLLHAMTSVDET
jgi:hypothetical protein